MVTIAICAFFCGFIIGGYICGVLFAPLIEFNPEKEYLEEQLKGLDPVERMAKLHEIYGKNGFEIYQRVMSQ